MGSFIVPESNEFAGWNGTDLNLSINKEIETWPFDTDSTTKQKTLLCKRAIGLSIKGRHIWPPSTMENSMAVTLSLSRQSSAPGLRSPARTLWNIYEAVKSARASGGGLASWVKAACPSDTVRGSPVVSLALPRWVVTLLWNQASSPFWRPLFSMWTRLLSPRSTCS